MCKLYRTSQRQRSSSVRSPGLALWVGVGTWEGQEHTRMFAVLMGAGGRRPRGSPRCGLWGCRGSVPTWATLCPPDVCNSHPGLNPNPNKMPQTRSGTQLTWAVDTLYECYCIQIVRTGLPRGSAAQVTKNPFLNCNGLGSTGGRRDSVGEDCQIPASDPSLK